MCFTLIASLPPNEVGFGLLEIDFGLLEIDLAVAATFGGNRLSFNNGL